MSINPRKLKKEKNDITLNIHDLNIVKEKQSNLLRVISIDQAYAPRLAKRLVYSITFGIGNHTGQNSCAQLFRAGLS